MASEAKDASVPDPPPSGTNGGESSPEISELEAAADSVRFSIEKLASTYAKFPADARFGPIADTVLKSNRDCLDKRLCLYTETEHKTRLDNVHARLAALVGTSSERLRGFLAKYHLEAVGDCAVCSVFGGGSKLFGEHPEVVGEVIFVATAKSETSLLLSDLFDSDPHVIAINHSTVFTSCGAPLRFLSNHWNWWSHWTNSHYHYSSLAITDKEVNCSTGCLLTNLSNYRPAIYNRGCRRFHEYVKKYPGMDYAFARFRAELMGYVRDPTPKYERPSPARVQTMIDGRVLLEKTLTSLARKRAPPLEAIAAYARAEPEVWKWIDEIECIEFGVPRRRIGKIQPVVRLPDDWP